VIRSESLKHLAPALVAAQKNMGAALKDAKNPFFKSSYADLSAVIDASVPVLNNENIAVLQTPALVDGTSVIRTVLLHASGEFIASDTKIVAAKSNDPQAEGSAISYARRYGLQATVTLKAEDDDGEKAMGRGSSLAKPNVAVVSETPKAAPSAPSSAPKFSRKAAVASTGDDI
jgi:hypothetical protein